MNTFQYPLNLKFHIATLSNDFSVTDQSGRQIAYVRQKMLRVKEKVEVFENDSKNVKLYEINANKWLDFSVTYRFTSNIGEYLGKVARKGWASLWRARYHIFDAQDREHFIIRETNGWVKMFDAFFGELPIVGMFTGYFFNPQYDVMDSNNGQRVALLKKEKSFFGRRFSLHKLKDVELVDEEVILLSCMTMLLLERRRG